MGYPILKTVNPLMYIRDMNMIKDGEARRRGARSHKVTFTLDL